MLKKILNWISTALVAAVVVLTLLLVGARFVGLRAYAVLSGSMEPTYMTGSLIYVKPVDTHTLQVGDVITFMLSDTVTATHRITGIYPDEEDSSVLRFSTKGDANNAEDAALVHEKNIIGTPILTVPALGYLAEFLHSASGRYYAIACGALLILLVFLPDLVCDDNKDKKHKDNDTQSVTENDKTGNAKGNVR